MNRTEALQAAFMIAGPNVTAEEHIQYAEFLLGDPNVIVLEDRISKMDKRQYTPHEFIGQPVFSEHHSRYPSDTVAIDGDGDVWYFDNGVWTCYDCIDGQQTDDPELLEVYGAVIVA